MSVIGFKSQINAKIFVKDKIKFTCKSLLESNIIGTGGCLGPLQNKTPLESLKSGGKVNNNCFGSLWKNC